MKIIRLGGITNNYLFPIKNGYALVDTGYEEGYASFCKGLKKRGIQPNEITYIFLTHAHDDHAGFLNKLLKNSNAKVILHPKALEGLRRGQNAFIGGFSNKLALFLFHTVLAGKSEHRFPPIEPQLEARCVVIDDTNRVSLEYELSGKIIETPGHTECSISLLLGDGALFCGDAAMNMPPSFRRATIWIGDVGAFCRSWEKIIALDPKLIYPGHGRPFSVSDLKRYLPAAAKLKLLPVS